MYCYLEFKLRHLKDLKLLTIKVKELFKSILMHLLRNRSLSNARGFYAKKRKIGKGNLYRNFKKSIKKKFAVQMIIIFKWVTYLQANFQIGTLIKQLLTKYRILMKLTKISLTDKNRYFKYNCNFLDHCLYTLFSWHWHVRNPFFFSNLASCEHPKQ